MKFAQHSKKRELHGPPTTTVLGPSSAMSPSPALWVSLFSLFLYFCWVWQLFGRLCVTVMYPLGQSIFSKILLILFLFQCKQHPLALFVVVLPLLFLLFQNKMPANQIPAGVICVAPLTSNTTNKKSLKEVSLRCQYSKEGLIDERTSLSHI